MNDIETKLILLSDLYRKLKYIDYNKLDLKYLEKLRGEVGKRIKEILMKKNRKNK